jgi:hypothetical protein
VTLVRDGSSARVYLNGEPEISGVAPPSTVADLFFGGSPTGEAGFEGKLDEIAVWGRALTAQEIKTHHSVAKGGK